MRTSSGIPRRLDGGIQRHDTLQDVGKCRLRKCERVDRQKTDPRISKHIERSYEHDYIGIELFRDHALQAKDRIEKTLGMFADVTINGFNTGGDDAS